MGCADRTVLNTIPISAQPKINKVKCDGQKSKNKKCDGQSVQLLIFEPPFAVVGGHAPLQQCE